MAKCSDRLGDYSVDNRPAEPMGGDSDLPRRKEKVMGEEFGALVLSLSWPLLEILGSAERTGTQGQ
jgi:hypothetical protein